MIPDAALGMGADGFDADGFRNAIKATMQMGIHPDPDRRPKFIRKGGEKTFWKDGVQLTSPPLMGREDEPLDPQIEVRRAEPVIISAPAVAGNENTCDCAVEIQLAEADEIPVGNFRSTKAVVTFLDIDYARIVGCKEMRYNGDRYVYGYEPEAPGLFSVGVHTIIWYALDES